MTKRFSAQKLAHGNKFPSATKSGPSRYHKPGHQKASPQSVKAQWKSR